MDAFDYSSAMKEIEFFLWHEFADHYIEMVKGSVYKDENLESIRYTLYTIGFGILKLFSPYFPHITEELYDTIYHQFEKEPSIHITSWPKPLLIDDKHEDAGELVKQYIAQVRNWKSEQGIALNAPVNIVATYASKDVIAKVKPNASIIFSTLKYPASHRFIEGKPDIEERISMVIPVYAKLGPTFKTESQKIIQWIKDNQEQVIKIIEKKGDISLAEIPTSTIKGKYELVKDGFLEVKKEIKIKGKQKSMVLSFQGFYLEYLKE